MIFGVIVILTFGYSISQKVSPVRLLNMTEGPSRAMKGRVDSSLSVTVPVKSVRYERIVEGEPSRMNDSSSDTESLSDALAALGQARAAQLNAETVAGLVGSELSELEDLMPLTDNERAAAAEFFEAEWNYFAGLLIDQGTDPERHVDTTDIPGGLEEILGAERYLEYRAKVIEKRTLELHAENEQTLNALSERLGLGPIARDRALQALQQWSERKLQFEQLLEEREQLAALELSFAELVRAMEKVDEYRGELLNDHLSSVLSTEQQKLFANYLAMDEATRNPLSVASPTATVPPLGETTTVLSISR